MEMPYNRDATDQTAAAHHLTGRRAERVTDDVTTPAVEEEREFATSYEALEALVERQFGGDVTAAFTSAEEIEKLLAAQGYFLAARAIREHLKKQIS